MKKFDLTKLDVAIKYVERMADGCNPLNNDPLGEKDILNNPNIIRCMYFIKEVLEEVRNYDGVFGGRKEKSAAIPFPTEILEEFAYREDQSITHVLNQIYEPIVGLNVKKVSAAKVTAALKEDGYLLEQLNPKTGKTRKVPGAKGKELGIYESEKYRETKRISA